MAETKKRIIQYNEELTPGSDDYLIMDSPTAGTRKILASNIGGGSSGGGGVDYSTAEQDTGLKWVDGRPIYQKTFQEQKNSISTGWQSLNYSIFGDNYGFKIIKSEIVYQKINNINPQYSLEYSGIFGLETYYDGSAPQLYSPVAITDGGLLNVTLWYTKATDAPTN